MKKNFTVFKIIVLGLVLVFGAQYVHAVWNNPPTGTVAPGNNVDVPVNVGSALQVKQGGLSVDAFTAYMNSLFKQDVIVETLSAPTATPEYVCTDEDGKLVSCGPSSGGGGGVTCSDPANGSAGSTSNDCVAQVDYNAPGTWTDPSYSSSWQLCENANWQSYTANNVTVTNSSAQTRQYLVIGQAFVGNDNEPDVMAYMLKEGNSGSYIHNNVIGFDQAVVDYSPPGKPTGRPTALTVMSVEGVAAGQTKNFNGWVQEVYGGCGRVFGMKTTAVPL